ncbi:MAG: hypothetical protein NVSMB56_12010 [Pyrinomonadaceae bacterium]
MQRSVKGVTPLLDYHERVYKANVAIDTLLALTVEARGYLQGDKKARAGIVETLPATERSVLNDVRKLPPRETIEWQGGTLTIDNHRVQQSLDDYEKLRAEDFNTRNAAKRVAALTQISEQLGALQLRLAEVNTDETAKARDKDADKGKLNAILHRKEFDEKTEQSALRRFLKRFVEWLKNLFPSWKPLPSNGADNSSLIAVSRLIIYALLAVLLSFIVWRFVLPLLRRRAQRNKVANEGARIVLGESLEAGQSGADLLREADRLAREGDWRGAIRKSYIALLCELGDRKIVRLAQHKTNRDYLRDLRPHPMLYGEMQMLTENFERHWYGFRDANADDWTSFRAHCRQAIKQ